MRGWEDDWMGMRLRWWEKGMNKKGIMDKRMESQTDRQTEMEQK